VPSIDGRRGPAGHDAYTDIPDNPTSYGKHQLPKGPRCTLIIVEEAATRHTAVRVDDDEWQGRMSSRSYSLQHVLLQAWAESHEKLVKRVKVALHAWGSSLLCAGTNRLNVQPLLKNTRSPTVTI